MANPGPNVTPTAKRFIFAVMELLTPVRNVMMDRKCFLNN